MGCRVVRGAGCLGGGSDARGGCGPGIHWFAGPERVVGGGGGDAAGDDEVCGIVVDEEVECCEPGYVAISGEGCEFDGLGGC